MIKLASIGLDHNVKPLKIKGLRMKGFRERIKAVLDRRFPNNVVAPQHYSELLCAYVESGIGPPHLVAEIETGDEGKLWSCIWEAMLYRHLHAAGCALSGTATASAQNGPDFRVDHEGRTIWIEATVPSPEGIPADWLEPPRPGEIRVKTKPDRERVLRCTSAIADKRRKFAEYRLKGIVGEHDCTVIAVNICRLSDHDIDGAGISQLPLVMEALFPIGPIGVPVSRQGTLDGPAQHIPRYSVAKASGREIQTSNFLDPEFANVSAVMQGFQRDVFQKELILSIIHNPLAQSPLPTGLFRAHSEFVATERGEVFQIRDILGHR